MDQGKSILTVALIVLTLFASACTRRSTMDIQGIREWAKSEGYAWREGPDEVRTEEAFFDYIDGAAQPIIDLGWKRSVFGALEKGKGGLRLSVHEMKDPRAAAALFEENLFDDSRSVLVGERAVYWDRGLFSKGILFQKKACFCELILEREGDESTLLELASGLEKMIP